MDSIYIAQITNTVYKFQQYEKKGRKGSTLSFRLVAQLTV